MDFSMRPRWALLTIQGHGGLRCVFLAFSAEALLSE